METGHGVGFSLRLKLKYSLKGGGLKECGSDILMILFKYLLCNT